MKIGLTISYDGTAYCGWQVQPNGVTVQETIQNAIKTITGETVTVTGSGRTDAGVHAKGQFAHFETGSSVAPDKFAKAINAHLPEDIRIINSLELPDDFHSVKSAKKKTYKYTVYTGATENPLLDRCAVYLSQNLDVKKMKKCAKIFKGTHDFKGYSASGGSAKTSVRTIYNLTVKKNGEKIEFSVTGNGFLYKMVRFITGAIISVGQGKTDFDEIKQTLKTGNQLKNRQVMPAKGLCLESVTYENLKK
jgi:tRNA pseudouridine38-40 synthase